MEAATLRMNRTASVFCEDKMLVRVCGGSLGRVVGDGTLNPPGVTHASIYVWHRFHIRPCDVRVCTL